MQQHKGLICALDRATMCEHHHPNSSCFCKVLLHPRWSSGEVTRVLCRSQLTGRTQGLLVHNTGVEGAEQALVLQVELDVTTVFGEPCAGNSKPQNTG